MLPKPLLPVGDRAILDVVVHQLRGYGFTDLTFAVGYLAHLIEAVFGDGSGHDVTIDYHEETEPLGTAGALGTIEDSTSTFLVMNGDVLTTLDYGHLYDAHRRAGQPPHDRDPPSRRAHRLRRDPLNGRVGATLRVIGYVEKPEIPYTVSMGVYVAEPELLEYIDAGRARSTCPTSCYGCSRTGGRSARYLYDGYWLDIGRHEDYEKAIIEYEKLKHELLGDAPRVNGSTPILAPLPSVPSL